MCISGVRTGYWHAPGSAEQKVGAHLSVLPHLSVTCHPAAPSQPWRPAGEREACRRKEVGAGERGPFPSPKDFPAVRISKRKGED